jgi:phosphoserine aminotransferase
MTMISFYPGPSRVYDQIPAYVKAAFQAGLLSANHRSKPFMDLSMTTIGLLHKKLAIPKTYRIFFVSSATECWEIIAQSLIRKSSLHVFNGAFGEKWFDYTKRLRPHAEGLRFDPESTVDVSFSTKEAELICITQNETSNGTQVSSALLRKIRKLHPKEIIAVDATSSMAGINLDFRSADVWFASVQKCFGLPSGLALLICSPRAIARANEIGEYEHYNSLSYLNTMMAKWQTTYTPNILGIYLLMCTLKQRPNLSTIHKQTLSRYKKWEAFVKKHNQLQFLIANPAVRSFTVMCLYGPPKRIKQLKTSAENSGFLLGSGYGVLKEMTFRVANFPALRQKEISALMAFLRRALSAS